MSSKADPTHTPLPASANLPASAPLASPLDAPVNPAHLILIGYRGSGKTTLARRLATRLCLALSDTDQLVEESANKTIAQIFQEQGEPRFRDLESEAISNVLNRNTPHVVSLGGGAILREANRRLIKESGWTAWLTASPQELARRIAGDPITNLNRPALSTLGVLEEISPLLERRKPYYSETANATYNTEEVPFEQLAERVAADYKDWLSRRMGSL